MGNTIIGGAIALLSVLLVKIWEDRRDRARWEREASRRFHDDRAKAYAAFLALASRYATNLVNWQNTAQDPIPPSATMEPSDLDDLHDLLVPVKIFGSSAAATLADDVVNEIWNLAQSDGESHRAYDTAANAFLRRVRIDLDIASGDGPPRPAVKGAPPPP